MKAYIYARIQCGECRSSMAFDESKLTVRCTQLKCCEFNKEYHAPSVVLKSYNESKEKKE